MGCSILHSQEASLQLRCLMRCAYCTHEAILRIPAIPGEVCRPHAIEFWTGLLTYAKENPPVSALEKKQSPARGRARLARAAASAGRRPARAAFLAR